MIAAGRGSEVFDLGDGRVLRRPRRPEDFEREAAVIEHARAHGFPVPRVYEVRDDAIVLERIDGRTMLEDLRRRPLRFRTHARTLASLHQRLHRIVAPPGLPAAGPGDTLLHLDFHPENVLLSPSGPVVVDWINARRGDAAIDVALTWVIAATSRGALGRLMLRPYLACFDLSEVRGALPQAAERRSADANVTDAERRRVQRLLERELR